MFEVRRFCGGTSLESGNTFLLFFRPPVMHDGDILHLPLSIRLIIFTVQDPDSSPIQQRHADQATDMRTGGEHERGITNYRAVVGAAAALLMPLLVYAGATSLFNTNSTTRQSGVVIPQNAQRIALLKAARNSDPTRSIGGGGISIVEDQALLAGTGPTGGTDSGDAENNAQNTNEINLYVVRKGDTLSQIADMFDVSTNTIVWANDGISDGTDIAPGDTLVILPISGIRHEVEEGETLSEIVDRHGGDIEEVRTYNNLSDNPTLSVGQTITIPNGEAGAPASRAQRSRTAESTHTPQRSSTPSYSGFYRRPVNGGVRTQGHHGYNAVDIGAARGTKLMAAADGVVIVAKNYGWNGGYGRYVVIKHNNGTQTLYAHNSENIVSVGQQVVQGQVIGYMGSTGKSTGPHVHFEIRGARNPF